MSVTASIGQDLFTLGVLVLFATVLYMRIKRRSWKEVQEDMKGLVE